MSSVLHTLKTVLPPPNFMRLPSVGVDVSDSSLKYVKFKPSAGYSHGFNLTHSGDLEIKEGTLSRGEVNDVDKLATVLSEVKKRTRTEYVRLSLPEERAYLFETHIKKGTPFKQVRGLLEFRLEENVPLSPRDVYFDYDIYELEGMPEMLGVSVTAYTCDTINKYYEACRKAGVTPLSFEVEAQAIVRAVLPPQTKGTYLIVDCGKLRTGIGIVHNGILMYTSTIDIGGKELSSALRHQLGEDREEAELTKIKNTKGIVRDEKDTEVYDALIATVSAIKDEISRRIEYWNNRDVANEDRFIDGVVLCGGTANLKGLPEYLTETLKIETERADVWHNAFDKETVPAIDKAHAYGYATAIGLGLANLIK